MSLFTIVAPSHDCSGDEKDEGDMNPKHHDMINNEDDLDASLPAVQPLTLATDTMTQTSKCYFAVKGAAIVLPKNDVMANAKKTLPNSGGPIQDHLHNMLLLLQPKDTLKMAVKLESIHEGRNRYLTIVSRTVGESHEECCLLGFDCNEMTSIGLVLPIWANTLITLDGDGGFTIVSQSHHLIIKPISVQAMWSALQSLHRASAKARESHHFLGGLTHSWVSEYEQKIGSDRSCLNEWHFMEDIESRRPPTPDPNKSKPTKREETEIVIRAKLREIMMSVDLEEVTCKFLRVSVEEALNMDLQDYRKFIDEEMLTILGQLDAPTKIYDYLYLGSEWNASNYEELRKNDITHVLNVTREIDNFFPGRFDYINIRVYDEEKTDLLKYWDKTYRYILKVKKLGKKCLVHCKMGKSRSASVVIAFVMKTYNWSLQKALDFVKNKRNCINPNDGFMKQLEIYEGILDASRQRHSKLWRSKSETNLNVEADNCHGGGKGVHRLRTPDESDKILSKISKESLYLEVPGTVSRPKSWSPDDNIADTIFPKSAPSSPGVERKNSMLESMERCQSGSLQRLSSIRDRISEFESQQSAHPKDSTSSNISRSGLVLNLANQFEAVSKPNTPSPVDDPEKESQIDDKTEIEPVISQTKPPASRHEAVLVRPALCSNCVNFGDNAAAAAMVVDEMQECQQEPLRSTSSTSIDSGVSCQNKIVEVPTIINSVPSSVIQQGSFSPKDDEKSDNDRTVSSATNCDADVMRSASSSSFPGNSIFYCNPCESADQWHDSCFSYEKEDIPWTPGTVLRTKEQLEENTLKRTKSFDSALKLSSGKRPANENGNNVVQRSQSLSVNQRGIKFLTSLPSPPKPPIRTTSIRRNRKVMHSSSSPSLSNSLNSSPPKPAASRSECKLKHCDSDEGLVMSVQNTPKCKPKVPSNGGNKSRTTWYDTNEEDCVDSVGVVRRLTQELEAKTREPSLRKEWNCHDVTSNSAQSCQRRPNRARIKSENISGIDEELFFPDSNLQRSSSAGSVSQSSPLMHNNRNSLSQPLRRKKDFTPFRVLTSQNLFGDGNQLPVSKPPPANNSYGCWKVRKHQPDYGKNHPVNKIVSRSLQENAFKAH